MAIPKPDYITLATITYTETAAITDLTGTKWVLNEEQINTVLNNENRLNVNFTSNGVDFTSILTATGNSGDLYELYYGNTVAYGLDMEGDEYSSFGTWTSQAYRIIEITGGADATDADLIAWLEENATQVEVTDLSGTEWIINAEPTLVQDLTAMDLSFTSNSTQFAAFHVGSAAIHYIQQSGGSYTPVTVYNSTITPYPIYDDLNGGGND